MTGCSMVLVLATGVFGLIPAWRAARFGAFGSLRPGETPHRPRLRSLLVVAELALAVVLVVSASLLVRTLWNLSRADPV